MQVVLNARKRNEALFVFCIFFLLTVFLVTIAIYFNFRIPARENAYVKDRLYQEQASNQAEENFALLAADKITEIDSMEKNLLIGVEVTDLDKENRKFENQKNISPAVLKMNHAIVNALVELISAKKRITELEKKAAKTDELQDRLNQDELSLDGYRHQNQAAVNR